MRFCAFSGVRPEFEPSSRYNSAREFLNALRNWDKDPASMTPKIDGYLKWLTGDIHDRILSRFVELGGDEEHQEKIHQPPPARSYRKYSIFEQEDEDYDDLLERATTPIYAEHVSSTKSKPPAFVENVRKRLMSLGKAVLVGEPGSGKSFMLMRLCIDYMEQWVHALKQGDVDTAKVPVLVYLNEYTGGDFADFVRKSMDFLAPYHDKLMREDRLVILCDALNEMPRTDHQMDHLIAYLRQVKYFVVSCRVRDYRDELNDLKPLEQVKLHDLELPAIRKIIYKRLPDDEWGDSLWEAMGGSSKLIDAWTMLKRRNAVQHFWDADADIPYLSGALEDAWHKIHSGARLIPLARNPYMADMLCRTYRKSNRQLPANRAELFALFISQMLVREAKAAHRRGRNLPTD